MHTDKGITLEDAPESTMQLWTFLLKISKVSKNGGVVDFEFFPISEALLAVYFPLSVVVKSLLELWAAIFCLALGIIELMEGFIIGLLGIG